MNPLIKTLYSYPPPPPRHRTQPIRILCVGLPRSGTESLSLALTQLGYKPFHGWDLVFDTAAHLQAWAQLAERKHAPSATTPRDDPITRADFDALLPGDCDVVLDSAAALFTPEILQAYPDAKVILNTRRDVAAWQRSARQAFVTDGAAHWGLWVLHLFSAEVFWLWRLYYAVGFPGLFGARTVEEGLVGKGRRVYREHGWMVKGLVPSDNLLEWNVEDGWGPLCEFLEKEVPQQPFPQTNAGEGFRNRVEKRVGPWRRTALMNLALTVTSAGVLGTAIVFGARKGGWWWPAVRKIPGWIGARWV
ncbi:sulfotransferase family protein [Aspergillus fijiensis CBS 313.89]|uniref:NAD dependent epimerase/dehydratase n=1 Tax=Aspergillus fijiensis CBS 313.89 TaxID=1448319 RepID=A0A8G1W3C7_9EURO|nr:uncharacterized protein BO72DRAFT_425976 [Aspergillus fijiensis CBS 313.89]RAK78949.1 hypothetical protein BO72DRAFT_425976 [Aspergillus fijiensis CBS 313.89]